MRLLIIEDEQTLQAQLSEQMRAAGFAVDTASDGKEEIGRASCRERVEISVVAGSLKKKEKHNRLKCTAHTH